MSRSHRKLARGSVLVIPAAAMAALLAVSVGGQQKNGGQEYLDEWVRVPFCGSVTITRNGGGEGKIGDFSIKESEFGQLTANITGSKDVINPRTGRASGFFLEGTVNTTFKFQEVRTATAGIRFVWDLDATGQKTHTYEGKAYHWTGLSVNRAQGLYRFDPPKGRAEGLLTILTPSGTRTSQESIDAWSEVCGEIHNVERSFDPAKGTISGFANFNWSKPLMNDFGSGFDLAFLSHEEKVAPKGEERAAELLNEAIPTGPVTFQVTWNLNLDTGACQRSVRIIDPLEDDEEYFGMHKEKELWVTSYAEATPKSYEQNIYPWDMSDIDGSTKVLKSLGTNCASVMGVDTQPVKGPCVRFFFTNLPTDNAQFGKKTITADTAEAKHFRVHYKKFGRDNPEGKDDNWFYYWKQGAVPGLEQFKYVDPPPPDCAWCRGEFWAPDNLVVYRRAALCGDAYTITLYERLPGFVNPGNIEGNIEDDERVIEDMKDEMMIRPFRTIEVPELKGVDLCHSVVLHELKHKWVYDTFHSAGTDRDGDALPDRWEILTQPIYQFDPLDPDTHFMRFQVAPGYDTYGDEELICREAGLNHAAVHELDWARPGKQSVDKGECNEHP